MWEVGCGVREVGGYIWSDEEGGRCGWVHMGVVTWVIRIFHMRKWVG